MPVNTEASDFHEPSWQDMHGEATLRRPWLVEIFVVNNFEVSKESGTFIKAIREGGFSSTNDMGKYKKIWNAKTKELTTQCDKKTIKKVESRTHSKKRGGTEKPNE